MGSGHKFCKLSGNEENGRKVRECEAGTGRFVQAGSRQLLHKCGVKKRIMNTLQILPSRHKFNQSFYHQILIKLKTIASVFVLLH